MNELNTVGEWVSDRFSRTELFEKWGIDFCCGGHKSLLDACLDKHLPLATIMQELEGYDRRPAKVDCEKMSRSDLCDHIEKTHHAYLKKMIPLIRAHLEKIVRSHGKDYLPLQATFEEFALEIEKHMIKEEEAVFPLFREKEEQAFATVKALIEEHEEAGALLEKIRALTHNYQLPATACMTLRTTWSELEELEKDMHLHVFKENHYLFRR